jgi:hypothetical protein
LEREVVLHWKGDLAAVVSTEDLADLANYEEGIQVHRRQATKGDFHRMDHCLVAVDSSQIAPLDRREVDLRSNPTRY